MRTRLRAEFPREKSGGRWKGGAVRAVRSCGRCAWSRRGNLRSVLGVAAPPMARSAAIIVPIGPTAHPSDRGSPLQLPCLGERRPGRAPIVLPSPYGPRMQTPDPRPGGGPPAPDEREQTAMPRRKSLTRRFLQHLLLISLARTILTAIGRGRAWDDWDERKLEEQAAEPRKFQRRFVTDLVLQRALLRRARALRGRGERRPLGARGRRDESRRRNRCLRAERCDRRERRDRGLAAGGARRDGGAAGCSHPADRLAARAGHGQGGGRGRFAPAGLAGRLRQEGRHRADARRAALADEAGEAAGRS